MKITKKENTKETWSNEDNKQYYENIPIEIFDKYTITGGFENGCDVDVIYNNYLRNAASIIDVGAGYGRVIKHLLDRGYSGKLMAIERSKNFYCSLYKKFSGRAKLFNCSVEDFKETKIANVALCMWSMLSEWPKDKQVEILKHITTFCKPGGIVILENISHLITPKNVNVYEQKLYKAKTEYGILCGYIASTEEINYYAKAIGITKTKHITYITLTGRERIIHVLWV